MRKGKTNRKKTPEFTAKSNNQRPDSPAGPTSDFTIIYFFGTFSIHSEALQQNFFKLFHALDTFFIEKAQRPFFQ